MKAVKIVSGTCLLVILFTCAVYSQQQFTHTVTSQNKYCNSTCSLMDMPALANNPSAIIIITPLSAALNPHTVGVYYVTEKKQWSAVNVNNVSIADGAKFNVQYYTNPDPSRFVYVVPKQGYACIDRSGLNGNPGAQVRISPTAAPNGAYFNQHESKVEYDAPKLKWCISNVNYQTVRPDSAFNVVFIERPNTDPTPLGLPGKAPVKTPVDNAANPPSGNAGGDLSGTYPNPTVQKLNGRPISNNVPKVGQILKWNGTEWIYVEDDVATSTPQTPLATKTFFKIDNTNLNVGQATLNDLTSRRNLTALSHSIILDKKSRLIISAAIHIGGEFQSIGTLTDGRGWFFIRVNNNDEAASSTHFGAPTNSSTTENISNYMIDLNPGTYNIEFIVVHQFTTTQFSAVGQYSSIIVIPL